MARPCHPWEFHHPVLHLDSLNLRSGQCLRQGPLATKNSHALTNVATLFRYESFSIRPSNNLVYGVVVSEDWARALSRKWWTVRTTSSPVSALPSGPKLRSNKRSFISSSRSE